MSEKTLPEAFEAGWCAAAAWAGREDLLADIGSPAYFAEMRAVVPGAGLSEFAPGAQPLRASSETETLDDRALEDLARAEFEVSMSFGVSLDSFLRLAKTLRAKLSSPAPAAATSMGSCEPRARKDATVFFEVIGGSAGACLSVGDERGGYRLAGPKPWGGGSVLHHFEVDVADLLRELQSLKVLEPSCCSGVQDAQNAQNASVDDLKTLLSQADEFLQSAPKCDEEPREVSSARVFYRIALEELLRRSKDVLESCAHMDPLSRVDIAKTRDAAQALLDRLRAALAPSQPKAPPGLICPKCGVDRTRTACPVSNPNDCGIQIRAQEQRD